MAKFTAAQVAEHAEKILEVLKDGWQFSDLFTLIPEAMEIVEAVGDMSGPEKQEAAEAIIDYVIDETDTPWLPDALVDPILKKAVRYLIPILVKAANGDFGIGGKKSADGE